MGVGIQTVDGHSYVTLSYGGLQELRSRLIAAYLKYVQHILQTEYGGRTEYRKMEHEEAVQTDNPALLKECRYKQVLQILSPILRRSVIPMGGFDIDVGIDYTSLAKLSKSHDTLLHTVPGLIGLYKFVYHSDADGYHSPGDCVDIAKTLSLIQDQFKNKDEGDGYNELVEEFVGLFKEAVELQTSVRYT